jgi:phosphatidylinositol alpha-1,6-mannosyltransferase
MTDDVPQADRPPAVRTLLVSNDFLPQVGGIQQYTDNILRRLPDAAAFVAAHAEAAAHDRDAPYPVVRSSSRYMFPTAATARELEAAVEQTGADVLLFATPWPLVSLGRRIGLPTAVCTHGAELIMPARIPGARAALARDLREADVVYSVSGNTGRYVRKLVGDDGPPVRLLRAGAPLERFTPDADGHAVRARYDLDGHPVVVCVGRLVRRKGQDVLVKAWPRVREAIPDARLLLVGDGPLRDDLAAAAARQPDGAVTLTGRVPWDELPAHHAAADVFAHPNRDRWLGLESEGFGVIFLEAQSVGRPVVAGDSGGAPEALLPGRTGLLVDGSSVDDVASVIIELLSDPARCRQMGAAGRRFVEEQFDPDVIVARLHDDLTELAQGRRLQTEF